MRSEIVVGAPGAGSLGKSEFGLKRSDVEYFIGLCYRYRYLRFHNICIVKIEGRYE